MENQQLLARRSFLKYVGAGMAGLAVTASGCMIRKIMASTANKVKYVIHLTRPALELYERTHVLPDHIEAFDKFIRPLKKS